jgi:hypothetical protein
MRATIFSFLSMLYCGQAQAQFSCYFSNSSECKFLALCKPKASGSACICAWEQVKHGLLEAEYPAYVELGEAIAQEDKVRSQLILSRMGADFFNRLKAVDMAIKLSCDSHN